LDCKKILNKNNVNLVPEEIINREKHKAREIRKTQWWKNRRARNICFYCERYFPAKELTMDHVVPLSKGGQSIKSNLVPCCKSCNNKKKNYLPIEWEEFLKNIKLKRS
tara:strand:- start:420 stop:743 length:324 start_codon:yes stop_codon:yes gene_type:complete